MGAVIISKGEKSFVSLMTNDFVSVIFTAAFFADVSQIYFLVGGVTSYHYQISLKCRVK